MSNVNGGWNGSTCGGSAHGFPQRTIYDSLAESNKSFKQYINLTQVDHWTGGQSTGSFSGFDGINCKCSRSFASSAFEASKKRLHQTTA